MTKNKDVILAGLARSGSTLTCHLLNKTRDVVALHEPIIPQEVPESSQLEAIAYIKKYFEEQRKLILARGVAKSKSNNGSVPDNSLTGIDPNTGKRIRNLNTDEIIINKDLPSDFLLVIKQPGLFTGMLGLLKESFQCYATVRNPLAVLRSWNTVDMPVATGRAPAAEKCDSKLESLLDSESDVFQRQIILLSWYFKQFHRYLEASNIIYYEDLISSKGKSLICIAKSAGHLNEELFSKNSNSIYDENIKKDLAERLLDSEGYFWKYYNKSDVLALL